MEKLHIFGVQELSEKEISKTDGGILPVFLAAGILAVGSISFGYTFGKDLYHAIND